MNTLAVRAAAVLLAALAAGACAKDLPQGGLTDGRQGTLVNLRGVDLGVDMADVPDYAAALAAGRYADAGLLWLEAHQAALRMERPSEEVVAVATEPDSLGFSHLKLHQVYRGLPVWGAELLFHWNRERRLYWINGRYLPTPSGLAIEPSLTPGQILAKAVAAPPADCGDCAPRLGIVAGDGGPRLVYRMLLPAGVAQRRQLTLDARSGIVLEDNRVPR
ncbi:MAG: hypothetical protein FIA97_06585 [Methylococcaceae bacterium]|nr:hypothetical protein [Desulfuromonas sp.]NJD06150.1 hypothetical protein [Methylococcaceae bacterium]